MAASTVIVLTAGTITFANEWYQLRKIDWRVPVATFIAAAGIDVLSSVSPGGATALAVMVLIGAATTTYNGQSAAGVLSGVVSNNKNQNPLPGGKK